MSCFWAPDSLVSVSAVSSRSSSASLKMVPLEEKTFLILEIRPKKGWHLLWKNAKDSALLADWKDLPEGFDGSWVWSVPERIKIPKGYRIGYRERVILIMESSRKVHEPAKAQFFWNVCLETCETESIFLSSEISDEEPYLSILDSYLSQTGDIFPLPFPQTWKASSRSSGDRFFLKLHTKSSETLKSLDFFSIHQDILSENLPIIVQQAQDEWMIEISEKPDISIVSGLLIADGKPYFVDFIPESGFFLVQAVFFAFFGGILLNLMPCVFPVLAMKAIGVIQASAIDLKSRWKDSLFYTLGIVVFFLILYLILTGIRLTGMSLGWGFQLQNPGFVFFLSVLFVFMALQMFGWIELPIGVTGRVSSLSDKQGAIGSFFSGAIAVLVATPCTAPFMGTAMAYAFSENFFNGFLVFLFLAVGMAFPMMILTNSNSLSRLIPKPGLWMVKLKEFFSFPLLITSVWLLWVLSGLTDRDSLFLGIGGIVVLVFLVWILKQAHSSFYKSFLLSVFLGVFIFLTVSIQDATKKNSYSFPTPKAILQPNSFGFKNAIPFTETSLKSLLDSGAPVFLYFTADWCVTCKFNEKQVFSHPSVEEIFQSQKITVLRADWTHEDEMITKKLESFGRNGVPLYVFYPGRTGAKPRILPQILTVQGIKNELRN